MHGSDCRAVAAVQGDASRSSGLAAGGVRGRDPVVGVGVELCDGDDLVCGRRRSALFRPIALILDKKLPDDMMSLRNGLRNVEANTGPV